MKTKHTPGPWTVSGQNCFIQKHKGDRQIESIAEVYETANAQLISAAPDLLKALESAIDIIEFSGLNVPDTYRAAIAKATGGAE